MPGKDPDWSGASPDPATSGVAPYRLYNIGNEQPVEYGEPLLIIA